jgi:hypothetical protein
MDHNKQGGIMPTGFIWFRIGIVACYYEQNDEILGSVKCGKYLG